MGRYNDAADKRRSSLPAVVFNEGGNKEAELYQQLFIYKNIYLTEQL